MHLPILGHPVNKGTRQASPCTVCEEAAPKFRDLCMKPESRPSEGPALTNHLAEEVPQGSNGF